MTLPKARAGWLRNFALAGFLCVMSLPAEPSVIHVRLRPLNRGQLVVRLAMNNRAGALRATEATAALSLGEYPRWRRVPMFYTLWVLAALLLGVTGLHAWRTLQFRIRQRRLEEILSDRTRALELSREAFRIRAMHDDLTGLLNRGAILEVLRREVARATRTGTALAVIHVDIDQFQAINDAYGQEGGDAALFQLGAVMRNSIRDYDQVGRYGDEEFLMVLPGLSPYAAERRLAELHQSISNISVTTSAATFGLTCSFGAAVTFLAGVPPDADLLLSVALAALEVAKKNGQNCFEIRLPDMVALPGENSCEGEEAS